MVIINCDMGEAFGLYKMGDDEGLMPRLTWPTSLAASMALTSITCARPCAWPNGMASRSGAHPSLPICKGSDVGR